MVGILKKFLILFVIFMGFSLLLPLAVVNFGPINSKEIDTKGIGKMSVKLYRHESDRVDEIDLEEYLEGVVAAEMPAAFDIEALKAQAVASRTYVVSRIINGQKIHNIADVCDTTHSQAYIDRSKYKEKFGSKQHEYIEKIRKAIGDTEGEVLYYNDEIVKNALYFAVSSGRTENAEEVFSFSEPYLKAVDSRFDQDAPNANNEYVFSEEEFLDKINKNYKDANVKSYDDVEIIDFTESGSIRKIRLGDEVIRGLDFRHLLGLSSSNLEMNKEDDNIIIKVHGYGHGVGLSQWGAGRMSELGYKYDEILKHYYTGVEVKKGTY